MTVTSLAFVYLLLIIPIAISVVYHIGNIREMLWAVFRMTVQLSLIGLYLRVLFRVDNPMLTLGWIVVMLLVAVMDILTKSSLPRRLGVVLPLLGASAFGIVIPTAVLIAATDAETWYTAHYVVPLTGMVLGNSLRGNIIALDTIRELLQRDYALYATRLFSGATRTEAMRPFISQALRKSLAPTISATATIGLVALPGMMTGQLLGGAVPMTAIRYQIAIMLAILSAVSLAAVFNIIVALRLFLDEFDMPSFS